MTLGGYWHWEDKYNKIRICTHFLKGFDLECPENRHAVFGGPLALYLFAIGVKLQGNPLQCRDKKALVRGIKGLRKWCDKQEQEPAGQYDPTLQYPEAKAVFAEIVWSEPTRLRQVQGWKHALKPDQYIKNMSATKIWKAFRQTCTEQDFNWNTITRTYSCFSTAREFLQFLLYCADNNEDESEHMIVQKSTQYEKLTRFTLVRV